MDPAINSDPMAVGRDSKLRTLLCCALLAVVTTVAYANSFQGSFVYDDKLCLAGDRVIDEWFPERPKVPSTGRGRWLTHLTFVANYKLHRYHVHGYHAVNLAIHLAAGLALFGLVRRTLLLDATRASFESSAHGIALAVALIWLVHPLQTESVTYIVQRLESLAGMIFLVSMYMLLRGAQSRWSWIWYLGAGTLLWVGKGAKETMYLAPLALLLYDRVYLSASWREAWRKRWPAHGIGLVTLGFVVYVLTKHFTSDKARSMGFAFKGISPWEYLRSQPEVILHYLRLSFWPDRQCLDYGWPVQHDPRIYLGLGAIVLALVIASLALLWYRPRIGFVAFMFFFVLAPTSSFMPIRDLAFEHRMYLSLASLAILVVLAMHALSRQALPRPLSRFAISAFVVAMMVGTLTLRTIERNRDYYDPVVMWQGVVEEAPWNQRGAYNLGQLLVYRGMTDSATYQRLLLQDPLRLEKEGNRHQFAPLVGDLAEAKRWFERALELDPKDSSAHFNLGGLHDRAGLAEEAIAHYRNTLLHNPKHLNACMNLARLLSEQGEFVEGTQFAQRAIKLAPKDARPHTSLGSVLALEGRHEEAIECFRTAFGHQPQHVSSRYKLALSLWALDREAEAIAMLREVRLSQRNLADVNVTLARYLVETSDPALFAPAEGAVIVQTVAESSNAQRVEAHEVLARCQAELGRYDLAAKTIDRGLELADPARHAAAIAALRALRERVTSHVSLAN